MSIATTGRERTIEEHADLLTVSGWEFVTPRREDERMAAIEAVRE